MCSQCVEPVQSNSAAQVPALKWEGRLIRRPGASVEDGKVYLVKDGIKHWVVSAHWLKQHGYNFPADVQLVSAQDLATIPEGNPIQ